MMLSTAVSLAGAVLAVAASPKEKAPQKHSLFQLVQGYPLEVPLGTDDSRVLLSWIPSTLLDEQTGYSQGSHGIMLTRGSRDGTAVWSLWGDGQSTTNHWWVNVFDTALADTPGGTRQLHPCDPDTTVCAGLSAPLVLTGASHGATPADFAFDPHLNATIALFSSPGSDSTVVALKEIALPAVAGGRKEEDARDGGGTCVCATDLSPSDSIPWDTNVFDMAVDPSTTTVFLWGLADNSNYFVNAYDYSATEKRTHNVLEGLRPQGGSTDEVAFVASPTDRLLWLVWSNHNTANATALAFDLDNLHRDATPSRRIDFHIPLAYFQPGLPGPVAGSTSKSDGADGECLVASPEGQVYTFDCKTAGSLNPIRTAFSHGSLFPYSFVAPSTGRGSSGVGQGGDAGASLGESAPAAYSLIQGPNTSVGVSLKWPLLPPSSSEPDYLVGSLSNVAPAFGCTGWPCNRGLFSAALLTPVASGGANHGPTALRAVVEPDDSSGGFRVVEVDLVSGDTTDFASVGSQTTAGTRYGDWVLDSTTNTLWLYTKPKTISSSDRASSLTFATLSRGDTAPHKQFTVALTGSSESQMTVAVQSAAAERSGSPPGPVLIVLESATGANTFTLQAIAGSTGRVLSSRSYNLTTPDVFGDIDLDIAVGSLAVVPTAGGSKLYLPASASDDARCASSGSAFLLQVPLDPSGNLGGVEVVSLQCTGQDGTAYTDGAVVYVAQTNALAVPWNSPPWMVFDLSGSNKTFVPPLLTPARPYSWTAVGS